MAHLRRSFRRAFLVGLVALVAGLVTLIPSSAMATFPGPDGRIAFTDFMSGQVYAANPDGSGLVNLSHTPDGHFSDGADWSADGTHVAFSSDRSGEPRLYEVNADGTGRHRIAPERSGFLDFTPRYVRGGGFVYSRCQPGDGVCAIWAMDADGSNRHALTPFEHSKANEAVDISPDVSPNGKRIAFTRFFSGGILSQVYVMRIDGTHPHAITKPSLEAGDPSWSPDGSRIVFVTNTQRLNSHVWTMHADGTGLRRLTTSGFPNNDISVSYSPTGSKIAFASDRRYDDLCCLDLFVMKADGTAEHMVDTGLKGVVNVDWGPAPLTSTSTAAPTSSGTVPSSGGLALCRSEPAPALPPACQEGYVDSQPSTRRP
jgi:Tol biopolymer transport system component